MSRSVIVDPSVESTLLDTLPLASGSASAVLSGPTHDLTAVRTHGIIPALTGAK
ncbi:hypothetical protein J2S41_002421 [Catenuloplanes atrovinosus]|uniref:Uncharacterized protein n=1 Tax=Catenuloplanes atrovinosus TaxID=137266 RepID=A0AAE3YNU0_9ACTN|nr:hypothetical protein [Catenuloplanes atrovinosus]